MTLTQENASQVADTDTETYDVAVIGAGFSGMYMLHKLRELGFSAHLIERGGDVGGTWYWNRYPGARCDVESTFYNYTFDETLQQEWTWSERYPSQPELFRYASWIADRLDLRRDISFDTNVDSTEYHRARDLWVTRTDSDRTIESRYLVTAVGCLSASRVPKFEGVQDFRGETYHTGLWPHEGVDFSGKRVAVIGSGSSGIQAIQEIAKQATDLTVFQRTANFTLPAQNRPLEEEQIAQIKSNYTAQNEAVRQSSFGMTGPVRDRSIKDIPAKELKADLDALWEKGGFYFMFAYPEVVVDEEANEILSEYVRERIRGIVDDPAVAELLCPQTHPIGTKRICVAINYYETYNRDNVHLVDISTTPIERLTEQGLVVDGVEYEVDAIVFATGFDAMTGPLNKIDIRGTDGQTLKDKWSEGPRTYLGIATAGFPNMFMITAPGSPSVLSNMMVSIEQHVEWVADTLVYQRDHNLTRFEATQNAEDSWGDHVNDVASYTLHPRAASWYMGANIPGKPQVFMPYIGGVGEYRKRCDEVAAADYKGFVMT